MRVLTPEAAQRLDAFLEADGRNDFCVVCDFDNTITDGYCPSTSKAILRLRGENSDFGRCWNGLFHYYRFWRQGSKAPLEERREQCRIWYEKIYRLYLESGVTMQELETAADDPVFHIRDGWPELLAALCDRGIPVLIVTCGMGNIVELLLRRNGCMLPNVTLLCNSLRVENGQVSGQNPIRMTGLDKILGIERAIRDGLFPLRHHALIFGDLPTDFDAAALFKAPLRIGFSRADVENSLAPTFQADLLETACDILLEDREDPRVLFDARFCAQVMG